MKRKGPPRAPRSREPKMVGLRVDVVVARAFLGPPPPGKEYLIHLDGNLKNNAQRNLQWADEKETKAAGQPLVKV